MKMSDIKVGGLYHYKEGKWGSSHTVRVLALNRRASSRSPNSGVLVQGVRRNDGHEEEGWTNFGPEKVVLSRWILRTQEEQDERNEQYRINMERDDQLRAARDFEIASKAKAVDDALVRRGAGRSTVRVYRNVTALRAAGFEVSTDARGVSWVDATFDVDESVSRPSVGVPLDLAVLLAIAEDPHPTPRFPHVAGYDRRGGTP